MEYILEEAMEKYVSGLMQVLPGSVEGVYLTGSIALGDYHKGKSDVDFTVVLSRRLKPDELEGILSLHKDIERNYPETRLDGHYVTPDVIGKLPEEVEPVPVYHDGTLYPDSFSEINLITWFTLKKYGITLYGKPAGQLDFEVDVHLLRKKMRENLNTYWVNWNNKIRKLFSLYGLSALFDKQIEWGVLGVSRLYYTFLENDIASKDGAGEYAIGGVIPQHVPIIKDALRIRRGNGSKLYTSVLKRRRDMINYIDYMIHECNKIYWGG